MYNRRLSERLRYSVGGTYRLYGPRQMPESMISEAHASFVSCSQVFFACGSYFQNKVQRSFFFYSDDETGNPLFICAALVLCLAVVTQ